MGRVLQVRVSASTYRDEDVTRAWPLLTELVWPEGAVGPEGGGVLALVTTLDGAWNFAGWEKGLRDALAPDIAELVRTAAKLEKALANWKPQEANTLTDDLESVLDSLEQQCKKYQ
ncbi:MAG: hypothetical protein R3Y11_08700 [Pseudomonadota bacterium]